jgi:hypothetical protein
MNLQRRSDHAERVIDDLIAWDSEFHGNIQIKNIEQVTHGPTSVVEQNFVGTTRQP